MAASNPTDGWNVDPATGTWGVDVVSTQGLGIGVGGIDLGNGGTSSPLLVGPWVPLDLSTLNANYNLSVRFRNNISGGTQKIAFNIYNTNRTLVTTSVTVYSASGGDSIIHTAGKTMGAALVGSGWGRWEIQKTGGAGSMQIYEAVVTRARPALGAGNGLAQTGIAANTPTAIQWTSAQISETLVSTSKTDLILRAAGYWFISAAINVQLATANSTSTLTLQLFDNVAGTIWASTATTSNLANNNLLTLSCVYQPTEPTLSSTTTGLQLRVMHNSASNTMSTIATSARFSAVYML